MKTLLPIHSLVLQLVTIILITSCTKDTTQTQQSSQTSPPKELNIVANHWQQQGSEQVYMDNFANILSSNQNAQVYVETDKTEILISSGSVDFMGGKIWSANYNSDLIVYYENFSQQGVPFGYLNIKVVF